MFYNFRSPLGQFSAAAKVASRRGFSDLVNFGLGKEGGFGIAITFKPGIFRSRSKIVNRSWRCRVSIPNIFAHFRSRFTTDFRCSVRLLPHPIPVHLLHCFDLSILCVLYTVVTPTHIRIRTYIHHTGLLISQGISHGDD